MECHRSLGVTTLVALMATHRALSTPLTTDPSRACGTAAPKGGTPAQREPVAEEAARWPAPARPAAKSSS